MAKTENLPPKNLVHLHLLHVSRFASPGAESASCLVGFAAFALHCKHHMHLDVRLEPGVMFMMFLDVSSLGVEKLLLS